MLEEEFDTNSAFERDDLILKVQDPQILQCKPQIDSFIQAAKGLDESQKKLINHILTLHFLSQKYSEEQVKEQLKNIEICKDAAEATGVEKHMIFILEPELQLQLKQDVLPFKAGLHGVQGVMNIFNNLGSFDSQSVQDIAKKSADLKSGLGMIGYAVQAMRYPPHLSDENIEYYIISNNLNSAAADKYRKEKRTERERHEAFAIIISILTAIATLLQFVLPMFVVFNPYILIGILAGLSFTLVVHFIVNLYKAFSDRDRTGIKTDHVKNSASKAREQELSQEKAMHLVNTRAISFLEKFNSIFAYFASLLQGPLYLSEEFAMLYTMGMEHGKAEKIKESLAKLRTINTYANYFGIALSIACFVLKFTVVVGGAILGVFAPYLFIAIPIIYIFFKVLYSYFVDREHAKELAVAEGNAKGISKRVELNNSQNVGRQLDAGQAHNVQITVRDIRNQSMQGLQNHIQELEESKQAKQNNNAKAGNNQQNPPPIVQASNQQNQGQKFQQQQQNQIPHVQNQNQIQQQQQNPPQIVPPSNQQNQGQKFQQQQQNQIPHVQNQNQIQQLQQNLQASNQKQQQQNLQKVQKKVSLNQNPSHLDLHNLQNQHLPGQQNIQGRHNVGQQIFNLQNLANNQQPPQKKLLNHQNLQGPKQNVPLIPQQVYQPKQIVY